MAEFTQLDPSNDVHATALAIAWQMAQRTSVDSKDHAKARAQLVRELVDIMLGRGATSAEQSAARRTTGPAK